MKRLGWYCLSGILLAGGLFFALFQNKLITFAAGDSVPDDYYANYKIAGNWDKMIGILEQIEASAGVGKETSSAAFGELNQVMGQLIPYLPKSPSNNRTYKQCEIATSDLAGGETSSYGYTVFKEKCFSPFGQIVQNIITNSTVKPDIDANPVEGSAPLSVTLDARASIDPSNDTIPSSNFFRRYKDVRGNDVQIGKGPVINHTFRESGKHIVHLTVRSANRESEGVFDGEASVAINVAPKSAQIILFINGLKADVDRETKIGLNNEETVVSLDAQATRPMGARTIVSHSWEITNTNGYRYFDENEGSPGEITHRFPEQGIYTIKLEVIDNENNRIDEKFLLSISDPVAIIKTSDEQGTTATEYVFDGSASYSLTTKIRKYQRKVVDPSGNQIVLVDGKQLKQKFLKPGLYTISLRVTDTTGISSSDSIEVQVGSTAPVPSFIITPVSDVKYPSRFILDAGGSYDEDVRNGGDSLTYAWTFTNSDNVALDTTEPNTSRLVVTMNEVGTYKARLTVTDTFGESRSIEKDIVVESVLRPEMLITPLVSNRGDPVTFFSKVNAPVAFYEWDFGNGKKQQTEEPKVIHTYDKSGIYTVTLRVVNDKQQENILKKQVFVGQKDLPKIGWKVKSANNLELTPTGACPLGSGLAPAYIVERYEQLIIDASESRSVLGTPSGVRVLFHPQNDEIYSRTTLNYKFPELGCQWVEITVDDTDAGKSAKEIIYFDVRNALPIMQNITLQFPQTKASQAQSVGVGISPLSLADEGLALDPTLGSIVVKATVQSPRDPDGSISYFRRWYYPNNDDSRKEGFKITPAAITTVTFVIPKPGSPTEYSFVVEAVDNDGGKQTSEELIGKGPVVFFPPGEIQLDQPLVSLQTSTSNTKAGEVVTFTVQATVPSERPDFEANRIIKYDFDGDGIYDLTTKKIEVTHTYLKPGTYSPKVAVYYRDRAGVALSEKITVIKAVTPRLLYAVHDRTVLMRDATLGDIETKKLCVDAENCVRTGSTISGMNSAVYTYSTYGEVTPRLLVTDTYGNDLEKQDRVTLREEPGFGFLSIPEVIVNSSGVYEVTLGSALDTTWSVYLEDTKNCYIDMDITVDENGDGDPVTDYDVPCNTLVERSFTPVKKYQEGRVYRVVDGKVNETPLILSFLEYADETVIPDELQSVGEQIDMLLAHLPISSTDTYIGYYRDSLVNLKSSLGDRDQTRSLVIQLRDLVGTYPHVVPGEDKDELAFILQTLSDSTVQSAFGGSVYDTEKTNILLLFQEPLKSEVEGLFRDFEAAQGGNKDDMKAILQSIANEAVDAQSQGMIDDVDMNTLKNSLCVLLGWYEIPSEACGTTNSENSNEPENPTKSGTKSSSGNKSSTLSVILKRVLWIVGILALVFVGLIIVFAVKAKQQQHELQDDVEPSEKSA